MMKRNDRTVSLSGTVFAKLTDAQNALTGQFGFKPTFAQTIEHLCDRKDAAKGTGNV
jgi:hypothetical protein